MVTYGNLKTRVSRFLFTIVIHGNQKYKSLKIFWAMVTFGNPKSRVSRFLSTMVIHGNQKNKSLKIF